MRWLQIIAGKSAMYDKAEEAPMRALATFLGTAAASCLILGARLGAAAPFERRQGDEPNAIRRNESWVADRVAAWQPTAEESAFDRIGWINNLHEARHIS